jgi:hypothetical protein
MPENARAWNAYSLIRDQVRVAGLGEVIGLDLGAATELLARFGLDDAETLLKIRIISDALTNERTARRGNGSA